MATETYSQIAAQLRPGDARLLPRRIARRRALETASTQQAATWEGLGPFGSILALCKAAKPPPGFEPTPRSKVGSYRKKTAAGYVYWQPGEEVPKAEPGEEQVTAEHAGKTAARYAKLETKMRKQVGRALRMGGGERAMRLMEDYLEVSKRAAAWKAKHAELGGGEQPIPGKKPGLRPAEGRPAGKPEEKPQKRAPTKAERRKKAAEMRKRREEAKVRGPEEAAREKREAEEAEARQRKAKREGKKYAESEAGKKAAARVRRKAKRKKAEPEPGLPERYFKRVGQKREQAPTVEAKPAKGKRFRKGISLRKAKRFPVGTIREWKGKKYIKTTEGWVQYRAAVHEKPAKEAAPKKPPIAPAKAKVKKEDATDPVSVVKQLREKHTDLIKASRASSNLRDTLPKHERVVMDAVMLFTAGNVPTVRDPSLYKSEKAHEPVETVESALSYSIGAPTQADYQSAHKVMKQLASAPADAKLRKATVHRGMVLTRAASEQLREGDEFNPGDIASFSVDEDAASEFYIEAVRGQGAYQGVSFEVQLQRGTHLGGLSGYSYEDEVISGGNFRVRSIEWVEAPPVVKQIHIYRGKDVGHYRVKLEQL